MTRARNGEGGSVIEFLTYRLHDHTTADDARRYRDEAEVKAAWEREPISRLRTFLAAKKLWDEKREEAWIAECGAKVDEEINAYLETKVQPVTAMFDHLYADPPPDLLAQRAAAVALEGKRNG
jgi:2-oxoisovalerate dehydrogenase E1 component alpha subunit